MILRISIFFMFFSSFAQGQSFGWAQSAGGAGLSCGSSLAVDKYGASYVCGQMNGSVSIGGIGMNGPGSFLSKFNGSGVVGWVHQFPDVSCQSVATDPFGNIYLVGSFSGSVAFGPDSMKSNGKNDFFLAKFDSSGTLLWLNNNGGPGNDYINKVVTDLSGNVYITGSFESFMNLDSATNLVSLGKGDMFVAKYNTYGILQWTNKGGGDEEDAGTGLAIDLSGVLYVVGKYSGNATFYRKTTVSNGGYDIFITKYNSYGYELSLFTMGGAGDDIANDITLDGSANMYMTGTFSGNTNLGGKSLSSTKTEAFVLRYANTGSVDWATAIKGDGQEFGASVSADGASNVVAAGVFEGVLDINGYKAQSHGKKDIYIAKFDADGRLLWNDVAGGVGDDTVCSIKVDIHDFACITGAFTDEAGFGFISLQGKKDYSFFVSNISPTISAVSLPKHPDVEITAFPNPSRGVFHISLKDLPTTYQRLTVKDMTGKVVATLMSGQESLLGIDLSNQPDGMYILAFETKEANYQMRLIKG